MDPDENANPGTPANIAFRYRSDPFQVIWNSYFGDMKAEMGFNAPQTNAAARKRVVHTAMHGVGHKFAQQMFKTLGLPKVGGRNVKWERLCWYGAVRGHVHDCGYWLRDGVKAV